MDFKGLINLLADVNEKLHEQSLKAVNISLTLRNWFFGLYILEFEQGGQDRAKYGSELLAEIAAALLILSISNCNERELRRYRQFDVTYPSMGHNLLAGNLIRGMLSPESVEKYSVT